MPDCSKRKRGRRKAHRPSAEERRQRKANGPSAGESEAVELQAECPRPPPSDATRNNKDMAVQDVIFADVVRERCIRTAVR